MKARSDGDAGQNADTVYQNPMLVHRANVQADRGSDSPVDLLPITEFGYRSSFDDAAMDSISTWQFSQIKFAWGWKDPCGIDGA